MHPFTHGATPSGKTVSAIENAPAAVEFERERREQYVAERKHERRALNVVRRGDELVELPPPPTREELQATKSA